MDIEFHQRFRCRFSLYGTQVCLALRQVDTDSLAHPTIVSHMRTGHNRCTAVIERKLAARLLLESLFPISGQRPGSTRRKVPHRNLTGNTLQNQHQLLLFPRYGRATLPTIDQRTQTERAPRTVEHAYQRGTRGLKHGVPRRISVSARLSPQYLASFDDDCRTRH